ncbi:MAG: bifunctional nuclease family protein [Candidatus Sumerlaeia bacterium]|nr:bifunctional nuclease family protein [Candidatus Sumerlaeia bacterium]
MIVEMELKEIQINQEFPAQQIIILGEKNGERAFPIYIGSNEALAMDLAVRKIKTPRPLTHELIINIINALGVELKYILVDDLRNDTFHGKLVILDRDGNEILVDSRPSDAIVLACWLDRPIFVAEKVLSQVCRREEEF